MNALRLFALGMLVLGLASCKDNETAEGNKEAVPTTTARQSEDVKPAVHTTKVEQFADAKQKVPAGYQYIVKIGDQVPAFTADIATGGQITPADLEGKVTMLQFTASWCGVCRKEMPHIEKDIWQTYKDRKDFVLLGIDIDEERDKVVKFGQDVNVTYPLVLDPGSKIFHLFAEKGAGVTRNVIIDRTGRIVFMTRLFKEEEFEAMKDVLDGLMK
jgi:peroxiredoxin